jgi:hypothetical protein
MFISGLFLHPQDTGSNVIVLVFSIAVTWGVLELTRKVEEEKTKGFR